MNGKISVLIVEDDKRLSYINRHALESENCDTQEAFTLAEARCILKNFTPDVILLDVKLPDGSGFDFCREIRKTSDAHIIFLTSVTEVSGEMEGLTAGGNDYLRKPYSIDLLLRRVKNAALHRAAPPQTITRGSLMLDIIAGRAFIDDIDLNLQTKEFLLLHLLIQNERKVIDTEDLYLKVWGQTMNSDKSAIQKAISRLRTKLEAAGFTIRSVYNKGYAFEQL